MSVRRDDLSQLLLDEDEWQSRLEDEGGDGSPLQASLSNGAGGVVGLTGPNAHVEIERRDFGALLATPIVVPAFQRAYCWDALQARRWWQDLSIPHPPAHHSETHDTGGAYFVRRRWESGHPAEGRCYQLCVDGQQRVTTTSLLLAALRDAAVRESRSCISEGWTALVRSLHDCLFVDPLGLEEWAGEWARDTATALESSLAAGDEGTARRELLARCAVHQLGALPTFAGGTVLQPTFMDRAAFYELLTAGARSTSLHRALNFGQAAAEGQRLPVDALLALVTTPPPTVASSHQGVVKAVFDEEIAAMLRACDNESATSNAAEVVISEAAASTAAPSSPAARRLLLLGGLMRRALGRMTLLHHEVLSEVHLQAISWLCPQEIPHETHGSALKR